MKKMSVKATQSANGGRWKCNYCGKKTILWYSCYHHQDVSHLSKVLFGNGHSISWCF